MTWNNEPIFHHEDPEGDRIDIFDSPHGVVLVTTSAVGAVAIRSDAVPALIEALTKAHPEPEPAPHPITPQGAQLRMTLPGWGGVEKWVARCGACGKPVILEGNTDWVHAEDEAGNVR